jgi:cyanate permease
MLSAVAILLIGWISDKRQLRSLVIAISLAQGIFAGSILLLDKAIGIPLLILGMGISQAIFGLLIGIVWPRLFGLRHLGEIAGFGSAAAVFGSALGPVLFGMSFDFSENYFGAAIFCLLLSFSLCAAALKCRV